MEDGSLPSRGVCDETKNEIRNSVREPMDFIPESCRAKQPKGTPDVLLSICLFAHRH